MTHKDHDTPDAGKPAESAASGSPKRVSRRALLKGSATAMPAILTLHSGAALARSSNLISEAPYADKDDYGRTLCMDVDSVYPAGKSSNVYDLGDPPYGRVTAIGERDYRRNPWYRADRVSEAEMCKDGGAYYYRDWHSWGRWRNVQVKQGVLVSATALSSFSGDIVVTDL